MADYLPIIDNYWQIETGSPILVLPPSTLHGEIKPGSPSLPCFGYRAAIVDLKTGEYLSRGQKGVKLLPRTRSARISRQAIQAVVGGKQHLGDLSTLDIALEGLKSVVTESKETLKA